MLKTPEKFWGIGALITDLKSRGLLEDTIILIGGEFGRTPVVELPRNGKKIDKNFKPGVITITTVFQYVWSVEA